MQNKVEDKLMQIKTIGTDGNKFIEFTINGCEYKNENNNNEIAYYFDIKVVECTWHNNFAIMIMLFDVTDKILNQNLKLQD